MLTCAVLMVVSPGCRRSPFLRLADDSAVAPTAEAGAGPQIESRVVPTGSPTPPSLAPAATQARSSPARVESLPADLAGLATPEPTPTLDAAIQRAEAQVRLDHDPLDPARDQPTAAASARPAIPPGWLAGDPGTKEIPPPAPSASVPTVLASPDPEHPDPPNAELLVPAPAQAVAPDPAKVWGQTLDRLRQVARQSADQSRDASAVSGWKERAQVVDWLASETAKPANLALLTSAVAAIADGTNAPAQDGPARSAQIRTAVLALEDRSPLAVTQVRLCRKVVGFGSFEPLDRGAVKPGRPVILYCEMTGMRYETKDDRYVSRLFSRVELFSTRDRTKVWEQSLGEAEDQCRNRRRDYYVNYRICLPPSVAPGEYRLRVSQTDLIARQTASAELALKVSE